MAARKIKQYIAGGAVILVLAAFILTIFSLLDRTDREEWFLSYARHERDGWRYEVLTDGGVQSCEPVFDGDIYTVQLPEGTRAVRATHTITEDVPDAQLRWMCIDDGIEIFLDGEALYSDFPELSRDGDGFVRPDDAQWERLGRIQYGGVRSVVMGLPGDYLGRELTVITYFPENAASPEPIYPSIMSEDTYVADAVVFSVKGNATMTIYALLALSMAGVFLLDIYNDAADGKTLLLCLYFMMQFLNAAYTSYAGYYGVLNKYIVLQYLCDLYMAPLYLYLALGLKGRWEWPLCAAVAAWAVYEGASSINSSISGLAISTGPGALVVCLAVTAAFCAERLRWAGRTRPERRRALRYGLAVAALTAVYVAGKARAWGSLRDYLVDGVWTALSMGNYWPVVTLCTDVISYITVFVVLMQVVRRTVRTHRTIDVLQERSRLTMASYERVLRSEEAVNASKHEMRHHMTALAGLLQDGDTARAREYIASVTDALDRLPTTRYSVNVLVNTVAGVYLDQAKAQGIRVEYDLRVPAELRIADEDLSVFLTNMLENALNACRKLPAEQDRYIRLNMALQKNFLFIGCANSAPEEQEAEKLSMEERARRRHGYGIEAMRQIAEKYNSVLLMERTDGEFSVRSNFSLPSARTS